MKLRQERLGGNQGGLGSTLTTWSCRWPAQLVRTCRRHRRWADSVHELRAILTVRRVAHPATSAALLASVFAMQTACSPTAANLREPQASFSVGELEQLEKSPPVGRSLSDAVFTRRQASRGERRFQQACAACHRTNEMTRSLLRSTVHETVGDLFEQISTTMPQSNPGSLSADDYADILAYIFRLNDYPAGEEDLPPDLSALESVRIRAR